MDLNRQTYDKTRVDISDLLANRDDLEREVALDDSIGAIFDAIADLPDDNRAAVLLCRVERLRAWEAAEVLGVSVPALKSRLYRGMKLLRSWLTKEDGGVSYFRRRR
jgi:RNA polymerase sigma-70 factor (ECF subfamily)